MTPIPNMKIFRKLKITHSHKENTNIFRMSLYNGNVYIEG